MRDLALLVRGWGVDRVLVYIERVRLWRCDYRNLRRWALVRRDAARNIGLCGWGSFYLGY